MDVRENAGVEDDRGEGLGSWKRVLPLTELGGTRWEEQVWRVGPRAQYWTRHIRNAARQEVDVSGRQGLALTGQCR